MDFNNGIFHISDELKIFQGLSFDEFRKTSFYKGQNPERIVFLMEKQFIDNRNYFINLFLEIM